MITMRVSRKDVSTAYVVLEVDDFDHNVVATTKLIYRRLDDQATYDWAAALPLGSTFNFDVRVPPERARVAS